MITKKMMVTLDRVEEGKAVLIDQEGDLSIEVPFKAMPQGSVEGDIFQVSISRRDKKTKQEKENVARLIRKLSA